jgi:hypothetical protein
MSEYASSLVEFLEKLKVIPLESVEFHFEWGYFERWIKDALAT